MTYSLTTLKSLGNKLPYGIWVNGKRLRRFTIARYTGYQEVRLGELEDQLEGDRDYHELLLSEFLPEIILTFEGYPVAQVAEQLDIPVTHLFRQMYLADIVHLILCIRIRAYGNDLRLGGHCICDRKVPLGQNSNDTPHQIDSIQVRSYELDTPPVFTIVLSDRSFTITPPRLSQLRELQDPQYADQSLNLLTLTEDGNMDYDTINNVHDMFTLSRCTDILKGGAYDSIEMSCPACDQEWSYELELGINYEAFFFSLLVAPRQIKEKGLNGEPDIYASTEESLDEQSHILLFGEQAPLKSISEFFSLTPQQRDRHINKVVDSYKRQQDEMKKQSAQSKPRRSRK